MVNISTISVSYITISSEEDGQRLDNFLLSKLKKVPKSHLYRIIRKGEVRVNKKRVKPHTRLSEGDLLRLPPIAMSTVQPSIIHPEEAELLRQHISFDNGLFLVINKPAGLACHGGSGVSSGLIERLRLMMQDERLELVHRLDKPTSGCLLVSRKRSILRALHALIREKKVNKRYIALLHKRWEGPKQRVIDAPLLRQGAAHTNREVSVSDEGKQARTMFKLLRNYDEVCLVEAYLMTGRTHQIRVHAQSMGQPIVGDTKYGLRTLDSGLSAAPKRLYLHAQKLNFTLDKPYHFELPPDKAWEAYLKRLE